MGTRTKIVVKFPTRQQMAEEISAYYAYNIEILLHMSVDELIARYNVLRNVKRMEEVYRGE